MKRMLSIVLGLGLCVFGAAALAENATHVPGYTIHHNAFTTDSLAPQVAKAYDITRSKSRGMLNVSVIKDVPGAIGKPVEANITVRASNLSGQVKDINLREVQEGDAVYYIGDFHVTNEETLNFNIDVQPKGSNAHYVAKLSHQFYTD
jgi:hypothetical protein